MKINSSQIFGRLRNRIDNALPSLKNYENSDYSSQQRAKFLYLFSAIIIISTVIIIIYTGYVQLTSPAYGKLYLPVLIPEFVFLLIGLTSFILIRKGHFVISTHVILVSSILTVWTIIWFDKNEPLARLDTIVMALGILTILPLLISKHRIFILIYVFGNIIILFFVMNSIKGELNLPDSSINDFKSDVTIALVFIGVVGFSLYKINAESLDKAVSDLKKRLEVESALNESERKYKELTDLLPQTVFETDIEGNLTYINKNFLSQFGYSEDDKLIGIDIFKLIAEKDRARASERFFQRTKGDTDQGKLFTAIRKDGTEFPIQIFANVIEKERKIQGLRGIVIDFTKHVNAESELKKSRDQFQSLVSNIPGVTYRCLFDKDWTMLYLSSEIEKISGYSAEGFINNRDQSFESIIFYDDRQTVAIVIGEAVKNKKPWEIEYRIKHRNENLYWVYEKGRAVEDHEGNVDYLDGFILDITERKNAEKAVQESEQKYRLLFENAKIGIYQTTPDGKILNANPALLDMLGFGSLEELTKLNLENTDLNIEGGRAKFKSIIDEYGYIKDNEGAWQTKNGDYINILETATAVSDNRGKTIYYDGFVENITERKKSEQELEKYRNQLELMVDERTEELEAANEELTATNDELYTQRKELEDALNHLKDTQNRLIQSEKMASLGVLAAGIAHEINNPLNFISGGATGLESFFKENKTEQYGQVAEMIEYIKVGVQRASDIVTSLNHYSRQNDSSTGKCDIHSIIDNCLLMLNNRIKNRIDIIKDYTDKEYLLISNEGRLHQVFLNIIANSVQAIEGMGKINISTSIKKGQLAILIYDTGCGITEENLSKITDPFFTTKEPGKGTGLGLSITYNIIQDYGGTLEFESRIGIGTKASITLPLSQN